MLAAAARWNVFWGHGDDRAHNNTTASGLIHGVYGNVLLHVFPRHGVDVLRFGLHHGLPAVFGSHRHRRRLRNARHSMLWRNNNDNDKQQHDHHKHKHKQHKQHVINVDARLFRLYVVMDHIRGVWQLASGLLRLRQRWLFLPRSAQLFRQLFRPVGHPAMSIVSHDINVLNH